jgi:hypothetical protein
MGGMKTLLALLLLAGCAGAGYQQDKEQSAVLPRALGVGATAQSCFLFCIVIATFSQGNVANREAEEAEFRSKGSIKGTLP